MNINPTDLSQFDKQQRELWEANINLANIKIKQHDKIRKILKTIMMISFVIMASFLLISAIPAMAIFAEASFIACLFAVAKTMPAIASSLGTVCGFTILHGKVLLSGLGISTLVSGYIGFFTKRKLDVTNYKLNQIKQEKEISDLPYKNRKSAQNLLEANLSETRTKLASEYSLGFDKIFNDFDRPFKLQREAIKLIIKSECAQRQSIAQSGIAKLKEIAEAAKIIQVGQAVPLANFQVGQPFYQPQPVHTAPPMPRQPHYPREPEYISPPVSSRPSLPEQPKQDGGVLFMRALHNSTYAKKEAVEARIEHQVSSISTVGKDDKVKSDFLSGVKKGLR